MTETGESPAFVSEEIAYLFKQFDRNGDGKIQRGEFRELLQRLDADMWSDESLDTMSPIWDLWDANKDGCIDYDEFLSWVFAADSEIAGAARQLLKDYQGSDLLSVAATKLEVDPSEREIKIVATMGPAWESEDMLTKMICAGVDIVRLNCSHRFEDQFERLYPLIHKISAATGRKVEVLGDLQGPKFRTTDCRSDVIPNAGDVVTLAISVDDGEEDIVRNTETGVRITLKPTVEQIALMSGLTPGMEVLIEDGRRRLQMLERVSEFEVTMRVLVGGRLKARQGVNVPDLEIPCAALTSKDVSDAEFLLRLDPPIDYIAMSFVQKAADIQELVDLMDRLSIPAERRPKICPKIEKSQALINLDGILDKSQAMMVARGDLGVEIGVERVPFCQKVMVRKAQEKGLSPIIVATQMMESMIKSPVPQRSEISDVANAVWDGADAVMLSSEAAMGSWPVQTVASQASAALRAQKRRAYFQLPIQVPPAMSACLEPVPEPTARRTKISATMGFASQAPEMISKLVAAGVDIFRLNCAYRKPGMFEQCLEDVDAISRAAGRKIEVMADLQGPSFRVNDVFWTGVQLEPSLAVTLAVATSAGDICRRDSSGIRITLKQTVEHTALLAALKIGMILFIEEGKRQVKVTQRVSATEVRATCLVGGRVNAGTAIEAPGGLNIDCSALTDKDKEDVAFLMSLQPPLDYIAMSFVQKGQDLQDLIDHMDLLGVPAERRPKIVPRIERPQALRNLDNILDKAGGMIVARGELGFDLGVEGVPFAQKVMIHKAKMKGVFPVMVSTQLMESMIKNAVPTRAEVSDVANAVFDGADVVMLSGETAKGEYPVESTLAMAACARVADSKKHFVMPSLGALPEGETPTPMDVDAARPVSRVEASTVPADFFRGRIIVMMGPPASGKGTQCKVLAKLFGLVHLSVGDVIRDEIKRGTELGARVDVFMSRGDFVSDELTLEIVRDRLSREDVMRNGCLLDGFPRTGVQAADLARFVQIDRFILFTVPDAVPLSRAMGRLNDPVTGEIYHLKFRPPPEDAIARLVRRDNDAAEEVVRNRLRVYHEHLASIKQHFQHKLVVIDGTLEIEEVTTSLVARLTQVLEIRTDPADGMVYTCDGFIATHESYAPDAARKYWEEAPIAHRAPEAVGLVVTGGEANWVGTWSASYSDGNWNDGSITLTLKDDKTYHWKYDYVYARDHGGDTDTEEGTWRVEGNLIVCSGSGPRKLEIKGGQLMLDVNAPMYSADTMVMRRA